MIRFPCRHLARALITLSVVIAFPLAGLGNDTENMRLADVRHALNELYFELQGLRLELVQSGLHLRSGGEDDASLIKRLDDIETELREHINRIEEIEYRIGTVAANGISSIRRLRERVTNLEDEATVAADQEVIGDTLQAGPDMPTGNDSLAIAGTIESREFSELVQMYVDNDYAGAIDGLNRFLAEYPVSEFRSHAMFHLGESYNAVDNPERAGNAYLDSIVEDGAGVVTPSALMRIGQLLLSDGMTGEACRVLAVVKAHYPATRNALMADSLMQRAACGG